MKAVMNHTTREVMVAIVNPYFKVIIKTIMNMVFIIIPMGIPEIESDT